MNRRLAVISVATAAALSLGLSACSSHDSTSSSTPSVSVQGVSAADVAFAQSMIPHHEQAVEMADMALAPAAQASPDVKSLAKQIKGAQDPEIQQMSQWLSEWGAPSAMPDASGDMSGMDHSGHDMGGITMSGMMSAEDMKALSEASGQQFDTLWMQMMIAHHEGAVQMAQEVKASSDNPEVIALADQVIATQKEEINTMNALLAA